MDRPTTSQSQQSIALSGISSQSSAAASSLNGSQLNALVARRTALRAQLATVDQQLALLPPGTPMTNISASQWPQTPAPTTGGESAAVNRTGPLPLPIAAMRNAPRDRGGAQATSSVVSTAARSAATMPAGGEDSLPGALMPGRYAFYPKRLPGSNLRGKSRSSTVGRASGGGGGGGGGVVSGGVGAMPARGLAAAALR